MIGLHITTQGCKLNQFDSADLAGALRGDVRLVSDPAQALLIVVNTCTVTAAADSDARQALRRRRRESPRALIVATGCYAERDPDALRAIPEVDLVLRREERDAAAGRILEELRHRFPEELSDGCADRLTGESLPDFGDRSRAFLRVQEGCDLRCSYCVIPAVRGPSRSLPAGLVVERLRRLVQAGYREVVLTGVNTGDYGRDLESGDDLAGLLERLVRVEGDFRLRLNSVEPRRVTSRLVELLASEGKLARHLQVPLQSGSDDVLRAMRRNYRAEDYLEVLHRLRARADGIGLGADVIVGFPGETEARFEATARLIEESPLNYLHVFSYSARPGTPAAGFGEPVPHDSIRRRSRELRAIGDRLARAFRSAQAGRCHRALVLAGRRADGRARALTSNFIEVSLSAAQDDNRFVPIVITGLDSAGGAVGRRREEGQAA
ncbi:MAG TPA: tRNA (N(6)-L-threonylcarbamoyladenosine(37)-C(2))-methylthiotransferase MtaB [Candidatus Polarisedimenticolia bacterium]|nr:tRNA (N(6)-L-threonylcarbamoyladenosine(37)-C(2))-methylthiotransferase MtaB [Candidatus Polarisedimenticolia bacterium]